MSIKLDSEQSLVLITKLSCYWFPVQSYKSGLDLKQMSEPEAKQGKPVRTDSCFLSASLSQCTYMVVEDLCRAFPAVSQAPFQYVPVVWQMCSC